jgi:hypothetical protein
MGTFGSIALKYHSPGLQNLYAVVMAHDMGHPIAFHLDAINEVQNYEQVSREGIWWLPRDGVQDWLILTNQSGFPMDLTLSLSDSAGRVWRQKIALEPRATGRYSVSPMLLAAGLSGSYGGVKIESAAHAGSLDTVHVLFDENGGFSANLKMFNRDPKAQVAERDFARTGNWTMPAPMLALQHPYPALSLSQRNRTGAKALHPQYEVEQTLQPGDQMWIDIGEMIQRQIPDKSGNVLPLDLTSGSYQFNDLTDHAIGSLFEGKVMYDKTFGHVSYGCASCRGSL